MCFSEIPFSVNVKHVFRRAKDADNIFFITVLWGTLAECSQGVGWGLYPGSRKAWSLKHVT